MQDDHEEEYHEPTAEELAALATFMPSFTIAPEPSSTTTDEKETEQEKDEDGGYEFNLFGTAQTTKISIEEPVEATYVCPVRPMAYYLHSPDSQHLDRIRQVAISSQQVIAAATEPWPSDARRVLHLPYIADDDEKNKNKRWRPSKARRRKFMELKERERKSQEIRMMARSRGRGRGASRGGRGTAHSHRGQSRPSESVKKVAGSGAAAGYPRKGPAPV